MAVRNMHAGEGEHSVYLIRGNRGDDNPIAAQEHYLGIDAVSWFVNKESRWFSNRMASGVLTIELAAGAEKYDVGLGLYELHSGARVAPIFDRPVLPERVYRGGQVTIRASLWGIARDTRIAKLMTSSASAALSVVGGMVQTSMAIGPHAPLTAAGTTLVRGLREILDSDDDSMRIFDPAGFEASLRSHQIVGAETYVLLHRGSKLDRHSLAVSTEGAAVEPLHAGQRLEDGAWLLLRLRRESEYPREREWYQAWRRWMTHVTMLMDDVDHGATPIEQALSALRRSPGSTSSIYDEYRKVRDQILADGVITQTEAAGYASLLSSSLSNAVDALERGSPRTFAAKMAEIRRGADEGKAPDEMARQVHRQEFAAAGNTRPIVRDPYSEGTAELGRRTHDRDPFDALTSLTRLREALAESRSDRGL